MQKVFVYGGCTSRDAVDYYPEYDLQLHSYIARQSLISAYRPSTLDILDIQGIKSPFQKRMLQGDVTSSMPRHIRAKYSEIDLIVWDLMVERLGVHRVKPGGMVTRHSNVKLKDRSVLGAGIAFGTDEHFQKWAWALGRFIETLERRGMKDRVIVNATPWARIDNTGQPMASESGLTAEWFNGHIQRYWEAIEAAGIKLARVRPEDAIADPDHKWGKAFFHYVPSTYRAQLNAITALM